MRLSKYLAAYCISSSIYDIIKKRGVIIKGHIKNLKINFMGKEQFEVKEPQKEEKIFFDKRGGSVTPKEAEKEKEEREKNPNWYREQE